jgi:hypothetical protein
MRRGRYAFSRCEEMSRHVIVANLRQVVQHRRPLRPRRTPHHRPRQSPRASESDGAQRVSWQVLSLGSQVDRV